MRLEPTTFEFSRDEIHPLPTPLGTPIDADFNLAIAYLV